MKISTGGQVIAIRISTMLPGKNLTELIRELKFPSNYKNT